MPRPPAAAETPSNPRAVAAGIVFAMAIEADAFERVAIGTIVTEADGLTVHEGLVANRRVAWCVAGAGARAAARAATLLIDGHRPAVIVTAGFAGGLEPSLARGTVVTAAQAVDAAGGEPIALTVPTTTGASPPRDTTPRTVLAVDRIVTVDRILRTAAEKRALRLESGGQIVDMETHAVARVARAAGLPCLSLRVISDDAAQDLPGEITDLARPQSALRRFGVAIGAVGRRPGAALDLWRLYENAVVDGRALAAALADACSRLPT